MFMLKEYKKMLHTVLLFLNVVLARIVNNVFISCFLFLAMFIAEYYNFFVVWSVLCSFVHTVL